MNSKVDPKDGFDLIEYPCDFEFKAMCKAQHGVCLVSELSNVVEQVLGNDSVKSSKSTDSRTGKFKSVSLSVNLQNREQLETVYQALSSSPHVVMTL